MKWIYGFGIASSFSLVNIAKIISFLKSKTELLSHDPL
jgi:hypothetical protein